MLYNMFPHPCKCTEMIIRRLRRRLWGVCCCTPTLLENLKSKNKNKSGTRVGAYCIRPTNILSKNILRCTNMCLHRLRRRLWGVCCCAPTLLENLKSKNKNESGTRVGAYCIRPQNILSRNILHCTNTRLRRLLRRS